MSDYEFNMMVDMGVLGIQQIEVSYMVDDGEYKPYGFSYWMHEFGGKVVMEVTDYITDEFADRAYDEAMVHFIEERTAAAEDYADMER